MTVFKRVASFATVSLCVAGLIGVSTPGLAAELAISPISTTSIPSLSNLNDSPAMKVPAATPEIPGVTVQRLPNTGDDDAAQASSEDADGDEYASLSAAVEAQQMPASVDDDLSCLAGAVYFESKGEPLSGQLAVADVIINRANSGRFPSSICSVVTQPGQFSFVRGGHIPTIDSDRSSYRTAVAVAQIAMAKSWDNPAPSALYFHARRVSPGWGKTKIAAIGHHIFYR
jgi:N-acetylmuramoyl-L-alanine amidase